MEGNGYEGVSTMQLDDFLHVNATKRTRVKEILRATFITQTEMAARNDDHSGCSFKANNTMKLTVVS